MPHTSTYALTNATLHYTIELARLGVAGAIGADPALAGGVNTAAGLVTNPAVAEALGRPSVSLEVLSGL